MSAIEWLSAGLGLVCVALVVRRSMWNYAFGIASTGLLGIVVYDARLYSDALLQAFFVGVNIYGWINWRRALAAEGEVRVVILSPAQRLQWGAGCVLVTLVWGAAMDRFTDAAFPWFDGGIAIVSVAAQLLLAQRRWENWLLWIAVDVASVPLYAAKGLWVLMGLYVAYLALAVWGFVDWRRVRRAAGPVVA